MHNLLFCAHTLSMNYLTNTFLLVSFSLSSKLDIAIAKCQRGTISKQMSIGKFKTQSNVLRSVLFCSGVFEIT